ncbi:hypothetical protein Clacol_003565 [Clathrus columnatus]|uniref:VHS domain-containing protein n=1 Tax=Clathrus columnatus TaxID=1419009 RepID=A0AAV5A9L1_9AGAM|nr:hypothetical protein Clacol_003565 [Clathrus columnatus]
MKRLFKPKSSKSSQPNTIPTPIPSEQFRSIQHLKLHSEDASLDDLNLHAPLPPIPHPQSSPYPSPLTTTNSNQFYSTLHTNTNTTSGTNSPRHSTHSLLTPTSNPFKKKSHVHAATTILRSLDPDDTSNNRSRSPSMESILKASDIDRYPDQRFSELERDLQADQHSNYERKDSDRRHRDPAEWDKDRLRQPDQDSIQQERYEDRDKSHRKEKHKDKDKKRGLFSRDKDKDKDKDRNGSAELTRMIGYLTATASEDWSLVLEVCERASVNDAAAKEACKALRREFKYAEPGAQLSAARASGKKFLDSLEEVLLYGGTSPVVRERLMEVLAAAAYSHGGGFRALWRKLKPSHKPDESDDRVEGIPFDANDSILNFLQSMAPSITPRPTDEVIPPHEDMRRLFEECEVGRGNAQLLNQALTYARPEELNEPVIGEWYRKCRNSHDFIMAQIPWATAQADRSREEMHRPYREGGEVEGNKSVSKEEELLAALLRANEELLEVFRIYDDLQRLGIMEQEEREVQERSRKETRIDRTKITYIGDDGSFYEHPPSFSNTLGVAGNGSNPSGSRPPSPSPSSPPERERPPRSYPPPNLPSPNPFAQYVSPKSSTPPAGTNSLSSHANVGNLRVPLGPRQARPSRSPSPEPFNVPHIQFPATATTTGSTIVPFPSSPAVGPPVPSLPVNSFPTSVQTSAYPQELGHNPTGSLSVDIKQLAKLSLDITGAVANGGQGQSYKQSSNRSTRVSGSDIETPVVPSAKAMGKRKAVVEDKPEELNSDEFIDGRSSVYGDSSDEENSNGYDNHKRRNAPVVYVYDAAADRARELRREIGIPSPTVMKPLNNLLNPTSTMKSLQSPTVNTTMNTNGIRIG